MVTRGHFDGVINRKGQIFLFVPFCVRIFIQANASNEDFYMNHLCKVTKHNHLVEASYKLSLVGQRVFLLALAKINPLEYVETSYEITADEYSKMYGISPKLAYRDLNVGLNELYDADIRLNDLQLRILTRRRLVDEAKYHDGEGKISLSFPKKLHPFLCDLKSEYTSYRIGQVAHLKSNYSIRLFELILQFKKTGEREITLKKLREWFRIQEKYKDLRDVMRRIIKPSLKELNEKTTFKIEYKSVFKGRNVCSLIFVFEEIK
jgi:plasmid replication initiation protein